MSKKIEHTPGPWIISEGRSIQAAWETHEIVQVCSMNVSHWSTDPAHDDVPLNRSRNTRMNNELEANARIIAAAPELLAACKSILSDGADWLSDEANEMLLAVIAKAEFKP